MKTKIILFLTMLFVISSLGLFSQSSNLGFKYQGLASFNNSKTAFYNVKELDVLIEIGQYINGGETPVYQELHEKVKLRKRIFSLTVGHGVPELGEFTSINWRENNFYMKPIFKLRGRDYVASSFPIVSVPIAIYAQNTDTWSVDENKTIISNYDQVKVSGKMEVEGDMDIKGDSKVEGLTSTAVLEIRGGADIVEKFNSNEELEPGDVVEIDPENENYIRKARTKNSKTVIGVVSGANGVNPGIELYQEGVMDGSIPIAIAGRVYVKVIGDVKPGDLLVSSDLPGYAMKAPEVFSTNTVIGKALNKGENQLILMLVK